MGLSLPDWRKALQLAGAVLLTCSDQTAHSDEMREAEHPSAKASGQSEDWAEHSEGKKRDSDPIRPARRK
jgi:hypothetical protein